MEYLSLKQICEIYPFTEGNMRRFLLHRKENGLAVSVRKIGRRLYFRRDLFEAWMESHKEVLVEMKRN